MSSKLIRKSLQQAKDKKSKSIGWSDKYEKSSNNFQCNKIQDSPERMEQQLIRLKVQQILQFEKHSSSLIKKSSLTFDKKTSAKDHIFQKRMKKMKLSNTQSVREKPKSILFSSRNSCSIYNNAKIKCPKTVTKESFRKEREKKSMDRLLKKIKQHHHELSLSKKK